MIIREATLDDSDWIIHHRIQMLSDMGVSVENIEEAKELFIPFLKEDWRNQFRYFVIEEQNQVVGGCGLSFRQLVPTRYSRSGKNAYIWNMYVESDFRRKGYGRELVRYIVKLCKSEQIGFIELHASHLGKTLYASEGFENFDGYMALLALKPYQSRKT